MVKKLNHHNAFFSTAGWYGNLMDFSRLPISSAVHVGYAVSVSAIVNIAVFIVCEV
jgi:hypothetical protein